jgi:dihydroorotate dehydrogenase electron transfer subunit
LSAWRIASNQLRTTPILSVRVESSTVKTLLFKDRTCAKARPGQFLMLWIPGVDEIPLSILDADDKGIVSVAVKNVGEATAALHRAKVSDVVGVRGPFGNSFTETTGRVLMVGGGTGVVPLFFLAKRMLASAKVLSFVQGAKTKSELLFLGELEEMNRKTHIRLLTSTEDGTCGITGLCTTPLEQMLAKERFDMIYTCGPEPMVLKVSELAEKRNVDVEASLERLMRCAIGICGTCVIGKYRVCKDGPVFNAKQLQDVKKEFGISKHDFDGRTIPL